MQDAVESFTRAMVPGRCKRYLYRPHHMMIILCSVCLFVLFISWLNLDTSNRSIITDQRLADYYLRVKTKSPLAEQKPASFPVLPPVFQIQPTQPALLFENDVIKNSAAFIAAFEENLRVHHSKAPIILSVIDYGFMDMTLNFIKISLKKHDLNRNFAPVCLDESSKTTLKEHGYECVLLAVADQDMHASDFGSVGYYKKTNIKTWVTLQALKLGYPVLLSDVDIAFFKNPFPYFKCSDCDVHIQMDKQLYNSGFVYVRPTDGSLSMYENAWKFYLQYHKAHDQAYINMAITMLKKNNTVKVASLSWREFPCGAYYFEHEYRHFNNEPRCEICVIAHNNYLGTTAAKVYRFRENLLWTVDPSGYYSDPKAKYLAFENPYDFGDETRTIELDALKKAFVLAHLMKRILILPSFRCCNCRTSTCDHPFNRCSLLSVLNVKAFDAVFKGGYREHSFLNNDAVPTQIKSSMSPWIQVMNDTSATNKKVADISEYVFGENDSPERNGFVFKLPDAEGDAGRLSRYLERFSSYTVLRLHSLYIPLDYTDVELTDGSLISNLFDIGIECGLYEQWEESVEKNFFGKLS